MQLGTAAFNYYHPIYMIIAYDAGRDEENQHEDQNTEDLLLIGRAYLISNNVADLLSQTGQNIS